VLKVGENLKLRRTTSLSVEKGKGIVCGYVHGTVELAASSDVNEEERQEIDRLYDRSTLGRMASLVSLEFPINDLMLACNPLVTELGNKLAMHIVGYSPRYLTKEEVTPDILAQTKISFAKEECGNGTDEEIAQAASKISDEKILADIVFLEQETIGGKQKVSEMLDEYSNKLGHKIKIGKFVRFAVGEGIEKKEIDFAEEVHKLASASHH